ncbi:lysosomal acid phosphatase isoform X2 [Parasteatoda tepidariorum]|uniref:lysosomal acid phosphatase isoform X2 n=1 Tax=Parasteatoda tepidariorum TaxID=114398 RepID=UPI001C724FA8|nr:lysosomal acid phosphatase isoform X2 [Parasteatoda tepidariorum]
MLYRHGDRAPIELYPNDPNPSSAFPLGLGALTLLGRKQHFGLGKFFRTIYKDFKTSNPLEINVVSSDCDRCLDSAETNLASFYAPEGKWMFDDDVSWQPFPVRYIPKKEDRYLETDSYCPKADEEKKNLVNTPEGRAFIEKHQVMFDNLTINSGNDITEWTSASYLFDVLWIERRYNLTVPSWADPWWNELEQVADLSFKWKFNSPELHRLRAGPLLQRIIQKMQEKINGDIPDLKFQVYSAHDTNVAVVLNSLNLFNNKMPPYCATILFELYSGKDDTHFLRLLYLNSTAPEKAAQTPHILIIDGCTEFCPLDYFINYTQHLIPDDWEKECQIPKSLTEVIIDQELMIEVFFLVVALIIAGTAVFCTWKLCTSRRRDKYSYQLVQENYS